MDTIVFFIVYGFIVLWMAAWVWAIWRWAADILYGLNRTRPLNETAWLIAMSALYALLALIPLFVFLLFRARFEATFPG